MPERINDFSKGDKLGATRLNGVVDRVNDLTEESGRPRGSGGVNRLQTTFVKITAAADGAEWYTGKSASGSVIADGSAALDLSEEPLDFSSSNDCLIFNEAGSVSGAAEGHSLEADRIMRGFFAGVSPDGLPIYSVNPGGGDSGTTIPDPTFTGQILQAVTDNTYAWQFPVAHSVD